MIREEQVAAEPVASLQENELEKMDTSPQQECVDESVFQSSGKVKTEWKCETQKEDVTGDFLSALHELPENEQEFLKVAASLGSFNTTLLRAATFLSEEECTRYLESMTSKQIIQRSDESEYRFESEGAEPDIFALVSPEERLNIGRALVEHLSHEEIGEHIYTVLLQFHCGMSVMTNQIERTAIATLCLRAIHCAVAASDFLAACNYAEFGIQLLPPQHWRDEYDLTLALHNASAEVFHCNADYEKVDELVSAVLENARCFRDSLHVRSTRVHSLSSTNRMSEALEEGLAVLRHLGVKFPSRPRKYHVAIEITRTKTALRGKTNEMILRMPLIEDGSKGLAAMQILNLIFPVAYHVDRVLFVLINLRLVRLTMRHGLSAISTVGFAAYSVMLVTICKNKETGYRYSQLALDLLDKFGKREYTPRTYYFVYGEAYTFKHEVRQLRSYLLQAYQIGLESGDIDYALYNSTLMEFGFMLFSGDSIQGVEEKIMDCYRTAVAYKKNTVLLIIRPILKFLCSLTRKVEIPQEFALLEDLQRAQEGKDEFAVWAIHFLQVLLAYIFGDYESAATEARELQDHLRAHLHPGFSGILTIYCLSLLGTLNRHHGLSRWRILTEVKRSMKKLEQFSFSVPDNCLHKFNLVQAEFAVANEKCNLATHLFTRTISQSSDLGVSWITAIASERFASFLRNQGNTTAAISRLREAYTAYMSWGAIAKVEQLENENPGLFSGCSVASSTDSDTVRSSTH